MAFLTLTALLPLLLTIYLLYVKFSKTKFKEVKKKHPVGSPNFEIYRVLYSTRTLAILIFLTTVSVVDILVNIYKSTHPQGSAWAAFLVFSGLILPLGLFLWWSVAKTRKDRDWVKCLTIHT